MWLRNQLTEQDAKTLFKDARDYALRNGIVMRYPTLSSENHVGQVAFTLFPSAFPRKLYDTCLKLQPVVDELQLKIACDQSFIQQSLESITKVDDFTSNLLRINDTVIKEGLGQPIFGCISRADYMLDQYLQDDKNKFRVRQVEVNTISSSLATQSCSTQKMHKFLMSKYNISLNNENVTIPDNNSLSLVSQSLIEAYNLYGIELAIQEIRPDVKVIRRNFSDLLDSASLGPNKELLIENVKECAVVYFRTGYDPRNYESKCDWDTRLLLERSRAIKCPSINFHLSGSKKFQQILNDQEKLEKFLSKEKASKLAELFCNFWVLNPNTSEGKEGLRVGLNSPESLVLKPQREGGGHNIYGNDIKPFLENIKDGETFSQYILMEYINSPSQKNWLLLHDDEPKLDSKRLKLPNSLVTELGIYGTILADYNSTYHSRASGYLVRSKRVDSHEGGVAKGYAGVSSLVLAEAEEAAMDQFYES